MRNQFFPISIGLYFLFLLFGLGGFPLIDWDENIYGAASKSMFESGEFFRISVNVQAFSEKPPFYFWIANLFYKVLGPTEIATRLPSVLSGLIAFFVLVRFGTYLHSRSLGLAWAFIYSSSLLPLLLSRTAYIDHLFNTLLLLSVVSFYIYDRKEKESFSIRIPWILGAAFFSGIAVLTKGPLGLGIPIFVFAANRIWERRIRFRVLDVFIFGILGLVVLSSYYLTNYLLYGNEFLVQFFDFQKKLLTKSLESHTGPFYYHFIVAIFGFFPWSIFLFAIGKECRIFQNQNIYKISRYFILWIGIVLLIFSIVQTKLPHYSSSIYIGFSFFAAYVWTEKRDILDTNWFRFSFLFFGILIGLVFSVSPYILNHLDQISSLEGMETLPDFSWVDSIAGIVLFVGILFSTFFLFQKEKKNHAWNFLISGWLSLSLFIGILSQTLAPKIVHYLQDGVLKLYDAAEKNGDKIIFYKYLSFYPMFYREKKVHIIGSYKFADETELFYSQDKLSILCNENSVLELILSYPERKFETIAKENSLVLVRSVPK